MRKLLAIAALLFCALTAQAQTGVTTVGPVTINGGATLGGAPAASFTPVFSSAGNCGAGGATCTTTLSVVSGQFVMCGVGSLNASDTYTCTDTDGDSITNSPSGNPYAPGGGSVGIKEGTLGTTNGSEIFTCHHTTLTFAFACAVMVFNGTPTSGFDVALAGNFATGLASGATSATGGTTTTTSAASELAIGFIFTAGSGVSTTTASGPWTLGTSGPASTNPYCSFEYQILTTTGTPQAAFTYNNSGTNADYFAVTTTIK
jgi:hypothetical protein